MEKVSEGDQGDKRTWKFLRDAATASPGFRAFNQGFFGKSRDILKTSRDTLGQQGYFKNCVAGTLVRISTYGDKHEEETDAYKLLSIFPTEVWEKIYQLTECRDLVNLSDASYFFEGHLSPSKVCWIFKMICPILSTYMDKTSVLTCRQVCQDWKASLDDFLPNWRFLDPLTPSTNGHYVNFPGGYHQNPERMTFQQLRRSEKMNRGHSNLELDWCAYFDKIEDMEQFKSVWGDISSGSTGNPFLSGTLQATQIDGDDISELHEDFWPELIAILKQHGKRIRHLNLYMEIWNFSLLQAINILKDVLMEVPNLRELTVDFGHFDPPDVRSVRKWTRILEQRPFPILPHLQAINVDPDIYQSFGMFAFHQHRTFPEPYYQQLVKLEHNEDYCFEDLKPKPDTFPNLVDIKLDIHSVADLKALGILECQLKRVDLAVEPEGIRVKNVMQVLAKFGSTLTVLKLCFFWQQEDDEEDQQGYPTHEQCNLSFPHLKIIEFRFYQHPVIEPMLNDLLLLSSTLPPFYLKVRCNNEERPGASFLLPHPDDTLQVHGYVERMYESAIWELIPSLGEFRFEGQNRSLGKSARKTYTREGYEKWKG